VLCGAAVWPMVEMEVVEGRSNSGGGASGVPSWGCSALEVAGLVCQDVAGGCGMSLMGASSWSDCLRSWIVSGAGFWFHWVHAWGWLRYSVGVCWGLLWCWLCFWIGDWPRGLEGSVFHWVFLWCCWSREDYGWRRCITWYFPLGLVSLVL
jgi:hypothetical protein